MENEEIYLNTQAAKPPEQVKIPLYESVFAWAALALGFIFTHLAAPYFGGLWGGIFQAAFGVFIAVYAKKSAHKLTKSHIVMLSAAELFCLTPLFSANWFVCFAAAVYSFALYLYLIMSISGADAFGKHFVSDFFRAVLIRPFECFFKQPVFAFSIFKGKGRAKNVLYALLGLLIALPLTVVVVNLLMSSDETFKNVISGFSSFLPNLSFSLIGELILAVPIAMYLFGALFSVKNPAPEHFGAPEYRFLPTVVSYFAVSPICVFYLIYIIIQIVNVVGVIGGSGSVSYSDFARQGFFELCTIAVIDLVVIILAQTFSKRGLNDEKPLALRVYGVVLSVLTLGIIATALIKMFMYIGKFGMTLMRVYTSWFMILLAVIFVLMIIYQIKEYAFWKALFAAFTVLFAVLCFGNFEGNIAAYNISAYRGGTVEKLDVDHFHDELGIAAAAPAYKFYQECGDPVLKEKLGRFIENVNDDGLNEFAYFSFPRLAAKNAYSNLNTQNAADNSFTVSIRVNCGDVYGITAEYLLDGELVGGQSLRYKDNGAALIGDEFKFTFNKKRDFENRDRLSEEKFGVVFYVEDKYGSTTVPDTPEKQYDEYGNLLPYDKFNGASGWQWNAEWGGAYEFTLTEKGGGFYLFPMR